MKDPVKRIRLEDWSGLKEEKETRQLDTGRDLNNKTQKTAIKGALGSIRDSECNLSIREVNYYELS